ncbi:TlpA family protein disulfide reductase [Acidobacteriota bacterium]
MASALLLLMGLSTASAADTRLVDGVSGAPIAWTDWVAKRGPVAVLVWASWAPTAEATMDGYADLAAACADAGLHLVVLDVQESLEDGRAALGGREVGWLHDRHGALLKKYRIIEVPSLLLVAADGGPLAKLETTPEAVRGWSGS